MEVHHLNEKVGVGAAPNSEDDVAELAQQGFQAILNVQEPNEDVELPARDEALAAKSKRLFYLNFPVDDDVSQLDVDQFCTKLKLLPPPTYVHGTGDGKAAALAVIALARQNKWSLEEANNFITDQNLACREGEWRGLVEHYVS